MMDRSEAIKRIREGLQKRSGKTWSVKGGKKGTAWGWIRITSPPKRRIFNWEGLELAGPGDHYPSLAERQELTDLLDLSQLVHPQGESVPSGSSYWEEYVARAEGRTPDKYGTPYWD